MAGLTIWLAAEHMRQLSQGDAGRSEKVGKSRRLAAKKAQEYAEQQQREQHVPCPLLNS
jgi:hypothetical protein